MAGHSGSSSSGVGRGWRDRGTASSSTRGSRNTKRLIYTALTFSLIGVLIWYLNVSNQQVHFTCLVASYGPKLGKDLKTNVARLAPPLVDEATADFDGNFAKMRETLYEEQFVMQNLATATIDQKDVKRLVGAIDLKGAETLILYVNAHCLAIDATPYLLWNTDYGKKVLAADAPGGIQLFKLSELLEAVQALEVKQKLLILDCGQFAADPRAGVFSNEFPQLLRQEVAKEKYKGTGIGNQSNSLWVIASHSPLQTSRVWNDNRRSIFAHFVVAAIRGGPWEDEVSALDQDTDMSLYHFFEYIHRHVSQAVDRGSSGTQTPMFLLGGKKVVLPADPDAVDKKSIPEAELFLRVSYRDKPSVAEKPKNEKPKKKKPNKTTSAHRRSLLSSSSLALFHQQSDSSDEAGDAKKDGTQGDGAKNKDASKDNPAAPAKKKSRKPARKNATKNVFDKIEHLCQQIEDPGRADKKNFWSPVDYAPHRWLMLRRQLIWYQMRYRLELSGRKNNAKFIEQQIVRPLERITADKDQESGSKRSQLLIFADLEKTRVAFKASPGWADFKDPTGDDTRQIKHAIRLRNYLWYQVGRLIRHYGSLADQSDETYQRLVETIDALGALSSELERLETETLGALRTSRVPPLVDRLGRLRAGMVMPHELSELLLSANTAVRDGVLPASRRGGITDPRLARWADLYLKWITLEDAAEDGANADVLEVLSQSGAKLDAVRVKGHLKRIDNAIKGRFASPDETKETYRELGRLIKAYHDRLAARVQAPGVAPSESSPENQRRLLRRQERLLRLVDGRDAERISQADNPIPRRRWRPRVDPQVTFVDFPETLNLGPGDEPKLAFHIQWDGPPDQIAHVSLDYDDSVKGYDVVLILGEPYDMPLAVGSGVIDRFALRPKPLKKTQSGSRSATLVLKVETSQKTFIRKLVVSTFGREFVDVQLKEVIDPDDPSADLSATEGASGSDDLLDADAQVVATLTTSKIRPLPNRSVQYRLTLINRSGQVAERQVEIRVFLIDGPIDGAPRDVFSGDLSLDVPHKPLPQLTRTLTLSRGAKIPYPLIMKPSEEESPKQGPAKEKPDQGVGDNPAGGKPASISTVNLQAKAQPADEKKPPPLGDARYGLVIDIRDKDNLKNRWIHWFDFRPHHPEHYVQPIVHYDNSGNLSIRLLPKEGVRLNHSFVASLQVGHIKDEIEGLPQKLSVVADLTKPKEAATLYIEKYFPKKSGRFPTARRPIYISVDGHPRAFVFELDPDNPGPLPKRGNYRNIRIVAPADRQAFGVNLDPTAPDAGPAPIAVELEVDSGSRDPIQVSFADARPPVWRSSHDRAEHAVMTEVAEKGVLTLEVKVGDFKGKDALQFVTSVRERFMTIGADIMGVDTGSADRRLGSRHDSRSVIVDGSAPRVTKAKLSAGRAVEGVLLGVTATVADPGGVAEVKFYVLPAGERLQDEAKLIATTARATGERKVTFDPAQWTAKIDTEELMLKAEKEYTLWVIAKDRVGHSRKLSGASFRLQKAPMAVAGGGPASKKGATIKGQTLYAGTPRGGIKVTLTPTGKTPGKPRTATTKGIADAQGKTSRFEYSISAVPKGTYRLTAAGELNGKDYKQLDPVSITVDPFDDELIHDLKLTLDR